MDGNDFVFCTRCGAKMAADAVFCPECGAQMAVIPQMSSEQYFEKNAPKTQSSTMTWARVLLIAYAALSLISGFMLAGLGEWSINILEQSDPASVTSLLDSMGLTKEQYIQMCTVMGITSLISGALALISGVMCIRRRYNKSAVAICVIASFICLVPLFFFPASAMASNAISCAASVIIGLIVAYLIYRVRDEFED